MTRMDRSEKASRTKYLLMQQFMQLLDRKRFKRVTVSEVCRSAMVSRQTFYNHFQDKYQLLLCCMEQKLEQLETEAEVKKIEEFIPFVLDSLFGMRNFFCNTVIADPDQEIMEMLQSILSGFFTHYIEKRRQLSGKGPISAPFISTFCAGGLTAISVRWIQGNFNLSTEAMREYLSSLLAKLLI